jgi:hypothetical protein
VHWRDAHFRRPTTVHVGPSGKVSRRTVLMEEETPAEAVAPADTEAMPSDPESLRALADLEESRRAGELTEAEYLRRKREILEAAGK